MWLSHDQSSHSHSLFYSYSPEWRQHFEKHTIFAYVYDLNNTMTVNEPKLSFIWFIYLESIAWRLVVGDLNFKVRLRFYGNLVGGCSKTLQDPRKTGEGKRQNEFAEWHVAWLAEWHNYAEFNLWKMAQRKKFNRKACARFCRAIFGANLSEQSICWSIYYCY